MTRYGYDRFRAVVRYPSGNFFTTRVPDKYIKYVKMSLNSLTNKRLYVWILKVQCFCTLNILTFVIITPGTCCVMSRGTHVTSRVYPGNTWWVPESIQVSVKHPGTQYASRLSTWAAYYPVTAALAAFLMPGRVFQDEGLA